ncbi:MAG: hypothetical protein ACRYG4_04165 [Janthinobacterium lividum]
MAVITMPSAGIRSIKWEIDVPSQLVRSDWTGRTSILLNGAARRYATVTVVANKAGALLPWRAFTASARGRVNVFALVAVETPQTAATGAVVDGAGQTGSIINLRGLPASSVVLPAGALIHIASTYADWQMFELVAPLVSNSAGKAPANFGTPVRSSYADGIGVELANPAAIMRLAVTRTGWTVEPGVYTPGSFDCEESF